MFALLIFPACKTTKSIASKEVKTTSAVTQTIEQVQKNQPQYLTANVNKMSMEMNMNNRRVSASASCKIRKDSAMFISFQILGFEVAKAELMPDSIKVIDKYNRRYYVSDYSYFGKRFGVDVDFYSLQSLFTAQLFCIGQKNILPDSCKIALQTGGQNSIDFQNANMEQSTLLSLQNSIQEVLLKAKNSNYELKTSYAGYINEGGNNFPQKISLVASNGNAKASCDFSILRVEFNTNLKFQATATDRYTRGDIEQILKK